MNFYVFLIFLNLHGDPTDQTQKLTQPFTLYEDCMVFGQIKAGQQRIDNVVVVPTCLRLAPPPPGSPGAPK